jgi:hypothetical protein
VIIHRGKSRPPEGLYALPESLQLEIAQRCATTETLQSIAEWLWSAHQVKTSYTALSRFWARWSKGASLAHAKGGCNAALSRMREIGVELVRAVSASVSVAAPTATAETLRLKAAAFDALAALLDVSQAVNLKSDPRR